MMEEWSLFEKSYQLDINQENQPGSRLCLRGEHKKWCKLPMCTQSCKLPDSDPDEHILRLLGANPEEKRRKSTLPAGLRNVGNTCFANTVLQILLHDAFAREEVLGYIGNDNVIQDLQKLFFRSVNSAALFVDTEELVQSLQLPKGVQQDPMEFLILLFDHFERNGLPQTAQRYRFTVSIQDECSVCKQAAKRAPETQLYLDLELKQNKKVVKLHEVVNCQQWKELEIDVCPMCSAKIKELKRYHTLSELPERLCIVAMRFHYDSQMTKCKSSTQIQYEPILKVELDGKFESYELCGVIHHLGEYANRGHYVADILLNDGQWVLVDDTDVKDKPRSCFDKGPASNNTCYCFFYRRCNTDKVHTTPSKRRKLTEPAIVQVTQDQVPVHLLAVWNEVAESNKKIDGLCAEYVESSRKLLPELRKFQELLQEAWGCVQVVQQEDFVCVHSAWIKGLYGNATLREHRVQVEWPPDTQQLVTIALEDPSSGLKCPHGNIDYRKASEYKYVSMKSFSLLTEAIRIIDEEIRMLPALTHENLCRECIMASQEGERILSQIKVDHRNKSLKPSCWINRERFRRMLDQRRKSYLDSYEFMVLKSCSINHGVLCPHGGLCGDENKRVAVSEPVYNAICILVQKNDSCIPVSTPTCEECLRRFEQRDLATNAMRSVANWDPSQNEVALRKKKKPLYLIPAQWLYEWKQALFSREDFPPLLTEGLVIASSLIRDPASVESATAFVEEKDWLNLQAKYLAKGQPDIKAVFNKDRWCFTSSLDGPLEVIQADSQEQGFQRAILFIRFPSKSQEKEFEWLQVYPVEANHDDTLESLKKKIVRLYFNGQLYWAFVTLSMKLGDEKFEMTDDAATLSGIGITPYSELFMSIDADEERMFSMPTAPRVYAPEVGFAGSILCPNSPQAAERVPESGGVASLPTSAIEVLEAEMVL